MESKFADRKIRLKEIVAGIECRDVFPFLYGNDVEANRMTILKSAVINYLHTSLSYAFPDKMFHMTDKILEEYKSHLVKLPNMTPNGLILPKQENLMAYHQIHQAVVNILKHYNLGFHIETIHNPINIRLVKGDTSVDLEKRPKASTKLHTDIWAGEFANSIMIFLPVMGDIENVGVEFLEPPEEFYPEYIKILNDYSEGAHLEQFSKRYNVWLKNNNLYFLDSFLLHRTFKKSSNLRLSIDFRFLPKKIVPSDMLIDSPRTENYIPYEDWCQYGKTKIAFTSKNIFQMDEKLDKNGYAGKYEMISINRA